MASQWVRRPPTSLCCQMNIFLDYLVGNVVLSLHIYTYSAIQESAVNGMSRILLNVIEPSHKLLVASIIWTFGLALIIQFDPCAFTLFALLIIVDIVLAFGAAGMWTAVVVDQANKYHSALAPAPKLSHPIALGPGFYTLWVFAA